MPLAKLFRDIAERVEPVRRAETALTIVPTRAVVTADMRLLRLGLTCLVDNALRHGGATKVLLGVRRVGTGRFVGAWDNGAGVPQAEIEFCLSPLGTASAARMSGSAGIGLGLTIAQRAAALGGMGFQFNSTAGRRTCVGFILRA